jgi:hypothetical protein
VGSDGYAERARRECRAHISQLCRLHGDEPDGDSEAAVDYAYRCERETRTWDAETLGELGTKVP